MPQPPISTLVPYTTLFRSTQVDEKVIAGSNLILWGDPQSNKVLAKIADKLPIKWDDSKPHVPVLIYPNPLNPKKYVVDRKSTRLNSSHRCISYAVFCLKKK